MTREQNERLSSSAEEASHSNKAAAPAHRLRLSFGRLSNLLPPVLSFTAFMAIWEAAVRLFAVSPLVLPSPSRILSEFGNLSDQLPWHGFVTGMEAVSALFIGVLAAVIMGLLIAELKLFRLAVYPLIMAKQVIPTIVFAPILLVWFGYGITSKIVIGALVCFFPVVVNTVHGLTSTPPNMIDFAHSLGTNRWRILAKIRLPHALPHIYTSLKPAAALSMIGVVVGEFIGGNEGLGYLIVRSLRFIDLPAMFVATIGLVGLGLTLFAAVELLGMLGLGWYRKSLKAHSEQ